MNDSRRGAWPLDRGKGSSGLLACFVVLVVTKTALTCVMESLSDDLLRHVIAMMSLDTNTRVVTNTSEVDQRPLRVHQCLASWLGACGLVSLRLRNIARDAPVWRTLCEQAFPLEPSPSPESYARWRLLERDPSEARVITPADLEGCAAVLFVLRETDSGGDVRDVLHYEREFLQPKDGIARGDNVIHPPDTSSIRGGAFFPEDWARVSLAGWCEAEFYPDELPGLLSGELVLRRADGKLARLGILDFARTCCENVGGEGDADGRHLSAYCAQDTSSANPTSDCYWLARFEDEVNDIRLELVSVLYFRHKGQPLPNAPILSCWVEEVLLSWEEVAVGTESQRRVRESTQRARVNGAPARVRGLSWR